MEKKRVLRQREVMMCMQQDARTQDVVRFVMREDAAARGLQVPWDPWGP